MFLVRWFKDIFYDSTNVHLDSGRVIATLSMGLIIMAVIWNMHLRKEISLLDLGTGLAPVLGSLVVYVYHDRKLNASE